MIDTSICVVRLSPIVPRGLIADVQGGLRRYHESTLLRGGDVHRGDARAPEPALWVVSASVLITWRPNSSQCAERVSPRKTEEAGRRHHQESTQFRGGDVHRGDAWAPGPALWVVGALEPGRRRSVRRRSPVRRRFRHGLLARPQRLHVKR